MSRRAVAAAITALLAAPAIAQTGQVEFSDRRDPPPWTSLSEAQRQRYDLGHALFNTQWVAAGTPRAQRRDGLGPLFNSASCDSCHNEGARGQGAVADGLLPITMVVQLAASASAATRRDQSDAGDPVYGHTLNSSAIDGHAAEATVRVGYREIGGCYPDGKPWARREPHYEIGDLAYGALSPATVIKPRIGPALFGAGLLERVPDAEIERLQRQQAGTLRGRISWQQVDGQRRIGRFGWQAETVSIADQTARAFAHEMGLTSPLRARDDCSAAQKACRDAADGGTPEVSGEFFDALVAFGSWLAVPKSSETAANGAPLFASVGCAACHQPQLKVRIDDRDDNIAAYTDLLLHDLGAGLSDRDARGRRVASRWRTAPLWGLGQLHRSGREISLLHDGRARSVEQALLWHDGEAAAARQAFERLPEPQRLTLLRWVEQR